MDESYTAGERASPRESYTAGKKRGIPTDEPYMAGGTGQPHGETQIRTIGAARKAQQEIYHG